MRRCVVFRGTRIAVCYPPLCIGTGVRTAETALPDYIIIVGSVPAKRISETPYRIPARFFRARIRFAAGEIRRSRRFERFGFEQWRIAVHSRKAHIEFRQCPRIRHCVRRRHAGATKYFHIHSLKLRIRIFAVVNGYASGSRHGIVYAKEKIFFDSRRFKGELNKRVSNRHIHCARQRLAQKPSVCLRQVAHLRAGFAKRLKIFALLYHIPPIAILFVGSSRIRRTLKPRMVGYDVPKGYVFLAVAPELPPNGRDFHVVIELAHFHGAVDGGCQYRLSCRVNREQRISVDFAFFVLVVISRPRVDRQNTVDIYAALCGVLPVFGNCLVEYGLDFCLKLRVFLRSVLPRGVRCLATLRYPIFRTGSKK